MKVSDQIVHDVATKYGFVTEKILGSGKTGPLLASIRAEAIYRLRTELKYSYTRIAAIMGMKDHTSAIAAMNRYLDGRRPPNTNMQVIRVDQKKMNDKQYSMEQKNAQRINSYWAKKGVDAKARVEKTLEGYRVFTDPIVTKFNGRGR
jgi:hypothetical protein